MPQTITPLQWQSLALPDGMEISFLYGRPEGVPVAAVILLSPIFGVDPVFESTVHQWINAGFITLAPDYFFRAGPGEFPIGADGFKAALARWKRWDIETALADLGVVVDHARQLSPVVAVLGYCAGGELAMRACLSGIGDAHAILHAARIGRHTDRFADISKPLDLHYGGADTLVPVEEVEAVRLAASHNPLVSFTLHPGADHGFSQRGRPAYDETADMAAFDSISTVVTTVVRTQGSER